jgi:Ca2+-binding EF-hand superfamily protein
VSFDSGNTKRMNSVLQEYDEEIHGGRYLKCCKQSVEETRDGPMSRMQSMRQMFRMSFALNSSVKIDVKASYYRMFNHIDTNKEHKISKSAFESFLRSVGLKDEVGLEFALDAFQLMDLDKSGDIDSDEFIAFAKISKHMPAIRDLVAKFFDFVDVNGDRAVEISELDSARDYLNLPAITEADRNSLTALCNGDEELEFDMIVNFVTIFKLKSIIKEYQEGVNLDDSIRSSIRP